MKFAHVILAGAALAAAPAFAAVSPADAGAKLPAEMVQGEARYVTGGIGRDEAQAFRRAQMHYPLALEFANKSGHHDEFTADVRVVIRDAKGRTVLDTVSGGPFLLVKLPEGRYEIQANQAGKVLVRHATVVKAKPNHVGFLWSITSTG